MSDEASGAPVPAAEQVEKKEETTTTAAPDAPAAVVDTKPAAEAGGDAGEEKKAEEGGEKKSEEESGVKAEADQASPDKEESKESKDEPKEESKEEPKEESKDEPKEGAKEDESKEADGSFPPAKHLPSITMFPTMLTPVLALAAAEQPDSKPEGGDDDNKAQDDGDTEMKDAAPSKDGEQSTVAADAAEESAVADESMTAATPAGGKSKDRRKSGAGSDGKGKKLNRKGSKAKFYYTDAQPGDYFLVKLKGYPQWPVIISDEEMLPEPLIRTRPVTAKRADGTYREDYADGGRKVNDRTFPIMYLCTNEL